MRETITGRRTIGPDQDRMARLLWQARDVWQGWWEDPAKCHALLRAAGVLP